MKKIRAMLLAALFAICTLMVSGCSRDNRKIESIERVASIRKITMAPYEHIVTVPIDRGTDIRKKVVQYPSYAGYEPAGISAAAYGQYTCTYAGGSIVYTNNETVECISNSVNSRGAYVFESFGVPEEGSYSTDTPEIKIFEPGEHIISVPQDGMDIQANGAYKVVGVAETAYGQYTYGYGGGCVLFVNTVPVMCSLGPDGYTHFGAPVEEGFTLKLNNEGE